MRAELDETGKLKIAAKSAIESFALSHWFSMWQNHKAVLQVETIERRDGQPVTNLRYYGANATSRASDQTLHRGPR